MSSLQLSKVRYKNDTSKKTTALSMTKDGMGVLLLFRKMALNNHFFFHAMIPTVF